MKKGKRYSTSAALVEKTKLYEVKEALDLTLKTASAKFDETVELHKALFFQQELRLLNIFYLSS